MTDFVEKMAAAQGCEVRLTKERSGYQLYIPCPECLHTHGKDELKDPKYSINLNRHLGIGEGDVDYINDDWGEIERRRGRSSICMRTRSSAKPHLFKVEELLTMGTVTERHPNIDSKASVTSSVSDEDREAFWEKDPLTGIMRPPLASDKLSNLIPVVMLESGHPAREYLEQRGFDLAVLWKMFRTSYCAVEYPHGKNRVYWRKMPGGWKDTTQGRVVFHAMVDGTPMTWQARVIDRISEDGLEHYYWHPYAKRWDLVESRPHNKARWMRHEPFNELNEENKTDWKPSKYRTAKFSDRHLMGWDAAIEANAERDVKWCVLCEGPLDAARVGPGGLAVLGGSMSDENARKIVESFHVVMTAFDNDAVGSGGTDSTKKQLARVKSRNPMLAVVDSVLIPTGKDLGEMPQKQADEIIKTTLARLKRGL